MTTTIRILIVEDSDADAGLARHEIRAAIENCEFQQVETRRDYLQSIENFRPDLIVTDYTMPQFDGMTALKLALEHIPQTPVIVWTGSINEDVAVQCMKAGANNYVLKDNIKRLGPAVIHALDERQVLTERAQAEEALRKSEERFRTLYERMPLGYQSLNSDGCFLDVNQAWLDLLGYQRDEVIGHWFGDFLVPEQQALFQQRFPRFKELGEVHNIEFEMLCKDGSHTFISFDGRIGYNQFMQFKQTHCILADVTQRKRAEEALRASEAQYRTLVESLPDIIMRFDHAYRHLFVSPSVTKMVNIQPDEFVGKTHRQLGFDPEQAAYWETTLQAAFESGQPSRREFAFEGTAGKIIVEWDLIPEYDQQGQVHSVLSISRDITARKKAEEQIKQTLAEKETLLRELYHRTKNNMSVIIALLDLQLAEIDDERLQTAYTDTQNRIRSMALVHQKLFEARDLSRINLKDYISDLISILITSYQVPPGKLTLITEMEDIFVLIDTAIPCGLILNELISNVLKYAFPAEHSGEIRVELARTPDDKIRLLVADNGVGLPAGFDERRDGRLGLQNVFALAESQLEGQVSFDTRHGVVCQVQFRDGLSSPRI
jgi:two-component system sensor kinase